MLVPDRFYVFAFLAGFRPHPYGGAAFTHVH